MKIFSQKLVRPMESTENAAAKGRRGVALLLVMIGLVVCSLLTAGFLASQGTAIGIARNERDAERARAVAQSGIDMAYWLIKNRPDWRTSMAPGTWLNAVAVGDGTVSLAAASADGTSSFANDTTMAAILTSVGTVGGRSFTLTATIGPTGGGTVFRGGNFCKNRITLGSSDSSGNAVMDSYNSSVAPYSSSSPGSNVVFGTNYSGTYGLLVYFQSVFRGSFVGGSKQNLSGSVYQSFWATGPVSTSLNTQPIAMGKVILPNTSNLTAKGQYSKTSSAPLSDPGNYDSMTLSPTFLTQTTVSVTTSGIYHVTGNVTINSLANLSINDGVNAVFIVDGNLTLGGNIKFTGTGTLSMYVNGSISMSGASTNLSGNTANCTFFGTGNGSITMSGACNFVGAIYAPQSSMLMQSGSPKVFGAIITQDLTLQNSAAFHYDENLKIKRIDNITGGSAPAGTANYNVTVVGSTSLGSH